MDWRCEQRVSIRRRFSRTLKFSRLGPPSEIIREAADVDLLPGLARRLAISREGLGDRPDGDRTGDDHHAHGWLHRATGSRAVAVTPKGEAELERCLGVDLMDLRSCAQS